MTEESCAGPKFASWHGIRILGLGEVVYIAEVGFES
jgi:hypothetical protein